MTRYVARVICDAGIFDVESCVTQEYAETVARNLALSTGLVTDVQVVDAPPPAPDPASWPL